MIPAMAEIRSLVPAAQYVRMSTEDQQYSIANQQAAIQTYSSSHGYTVVSSYEDAGKSGIEIKHRKALRQLLSDVASGRAGFKAVLVYDVSRWGRFQDVDEAAYYEFLCRSAGIPVCYCAEPFENDGSPVSSIVKNLKRTMAAEYSRELGVKVQAGQRRLALLGFHVLGTAGYGLRRMMVSPDGRRKLILKDGEHKAIHTDRIILVPGPKKEVNCVRTIFGMASNGKTPKEIARELNMRNILPSRGTPWGRSSVYRILTNEKYAGSNIYGKTTQRLSSVSRAVKREFWSTKPDAFLPIVSRNVFDIVQELLRKRGALPRKSDAQLIQGMRKLLARKGQLTHRILKQKGILGCSYYKRFGSIMKAYEIAGYQPPLRTIKLSDAQMRMRLLRKDLYLRLKQLFPDRLRFITLPGQQLRQIIEIDRRVRLAVYLCRSVRNHNGEIGWNLRLRSLDRRLPILICTVEQSFSRLLDFYVVPPPDESMYWKTLRDGQPWLSSGTKLKRLEEFCSVANELPGVCEACIVVDDILISADTWTITIGKQEVSLGPIGSAILSILVQNAGQVVPRDRLRHGTPDVIDPSNLDAHIWTLRNKLGAENRKRIETVRGAGYRYVSPRQCLESRSLFPPETHDRAITMA
jgi:DNA invertase Pin-like site-specific DNA recombinase/DNA-binding winged helix-turn-helix (wHTH) protein